MQSREFIICSRLKNLFKDLLVVPLQQECFYFELDLLKTKKLFLVSTSFPGAMFTRPGLLQLLRLVASVLEEKVGMSYHHPKSSSRRRLIFIVGRFLPSRRYNIHKYGFFFSSVSPWGHCVFVSMHSLTVFMCCVLHSCVLALCLLVTLKTVFPQYCGFFSLITRS